MFLIFPLYLFQVMEFMCYFCKKLFPSLQAVVDHAVEKHRNEPLRFRQLLLNTESGKKQFFRKDFKVIPSEIAAAGQKIVVDETKGRITISESECTVIHEDIEKECEDHELNRLIKNPTSCCTAPETARVDVHMASVT